MAGLAAHDFWYLTDRQRPGDRLFPVLEGAGGEFSSVIIYETPGISLSRRLSHHHPLARQKNIAGMRRQRVGNGASADRRTDTNRRRPTASAAITLVRSAIAARDPA